jgi:hypothetical protein
MRLKKIIAATFVSTSAIATSAAADDGPISFLSRVIGPGVDRSAPPDTGGTRFRSSRVKSEDCWKNGLGSALLRSGLGQ